MDLRQLSPRGIAALREGQWLVSTYSGDTVAGPTASGRLDALAATDIALTLSQPLGSAIFLWAGPDGTAWDYQADAAAVMRRRGFVGGFYNATHGWLDTLEDAPSLVFGDFETGRLQITGWCGAWGRGTLMSPPPEPEAEPAAPDALERIAAALERIAPGATGQGTFAVKWNDDRTALVLTTPADPEFFYVFAPPPGVKMTGRIPD